MIYSTKAVETNTTRQFDPEISQAVDTQILLQLHSFDQLNQKFIAQVAEKMKLLQMNLTENRKRAKKAHVDPGYLCQNLIRPITRGNYEFKVR